MSSFVYVIFNTCNGKCYVGKSDNPRIRWRNHVYASEKGYDKYLYHSMRLYGVNAFEFKTIQELSSRKEALDSERYWVKFFKSNDCEFGYNLTAGGDGILECSEETRLKKSLSMRGCIITPEHRRKIGVANSRALRGVKHSPERNARKAERQRGSKNSSAKLNEQQVVEIKQLLQRAEITQGNIAKMFGVSLSTIKCIRNGKLWSHIHV